MSTFEYRIVRPCRQCGRPEHGSAACNPIAPIIITVDEELTPESCAAYRRGIVAVIKLLTDGGDLDAVMAALMVLLDPD